MTSCADFTNKHFTFLPESWNMDASYFVRIFYKDAIRIFDVDPFWLTWTLVTIFREIHATSYCMEPVKPWYYFGHIPIVFIIWGRSEFQNCNIPDSNTQHFWNVVQSMTFEFNIRRAFLSIMIIFVIWLVMFLLLVQS